MNSSTSFGFEVKFPTDMFLTHRKIFLKPFNHKNLRKHTSIFVIIGFPVSVQEGRTI